MPQAQVTITPPGTPGSQDNLSIGSIITLGNVNIGGELTYQWTILDQPPGPVDALSNPAIQNPTLTPNKEGTYLIRLVVNFGLPDEQRDQVIAAVRQLKSLERVPAAGETTEGDTIDGWATPVNSMFRQIDGLLSDSGTIVGMNKTGAPLSKGVALRVTSSQIIKSGLPGQEYVPGFTKSLGTTLGNLDELLCTFVVGVDGSASVVDGALFKARYVGRIPSLPLGAGAVGDSVYVSDTGDISATPGTYRRRCGSITSVNVDTTRDVWFDGVGGQDITPIDVPYVVYGSPGVLTNPNRVDGTNASGASGSVPYTFKSADLSTVAAVVKRFSSVSANVLEAQTETAAIMTALGPTGDLTFINNGTQRIRDAINQATTPSIVPLRARRLAASATGANIAEVQDHLGAALAWFDSSGNLDLNSKYLEHAIARGINGTDVAFCTRKFLAGATANLLEVQDQAGVAMSVFDKSGWLGIGSPATPAMSLDVRGLNTANSLNVPDGQCDVQVLSSLNRVNDGGIIGLGGSGGLTGFIKTNARSGNAGYLEFGNRRLVGDTFMTAGIILDTTGGVGLSCEPNSSRLHLFASGGESYGTTLRLQNTCAGGGDGFITTTDNSWTVGGGRVVFGIGGSPTSALVRASILPSGAFLTNANADPMLAAYGVNSSLLVGPNGASPAPAALCVGSYASGATSPSYIEVFGTDAVGSMFPSGGRLFLGCWTSNTHISTGQVIGSVHFGGVVGNPAASYGAANYPASIAAVADGTWANAANAGASMYFFTGTSAPANRDTLFVTGDRMRIAADGRISVAGSYVTANGQLSVGFDPASGATYGIYASIVGAAATAAIAAIGGTHIGIYASSTAGVCAVQAVAFTSGDAVQATSAVGNGVAWTTTTGRGISGIATGVGIGVNGYGNVGGAIGVRATGTAGANFLVLTNSGTAPTLPIEGTFHLATSGADNTRLYVYINGSWRRITLTTNNPP